MREAPTNDVREDLSVAERSAKELAELVGSGRFELGSEKATQQGIWELLSRSLPVYADLRREHRLSNLDVPDFFVASVGVAIEVKLKRSSAAEIRAQLKRYARHDQVQALVLVTNRAMGLPPEIEGKPVYYVSLGRAWL